MSFFFRYRRWIGATLAVALIFSFVLASTVFAASNTPLLQISSDPYTNTTSQHATEVEPDSFANGSTIVAATQVGRFSDGGASNVGWATSSDSGATWHNGFLPGTTVFATPAGTYDRVSDPTVVYDAAHKLWMIASLAISNVGGSPQGVAVIVNTSSDGGLTWNAPVAAATANGSFFDKDWIVCDNTATSPYYGHCYIEWDIASNNDLVQMSMSSDGGSAWGAAQATADSATGLGGQPLVQPNGTVIVPFLSIGQTIASFTSTDGGASWGSSVTISSQTNFQEAGIRTEPLPTAAIDGAGTVYVVWQDCRFESGCSANDLVMSTSSDGTNWSAAQDIPADAVGSGVDHFIPGLGIDPATSGSSAHLALAYYFYPNAACSASTCQLEVGFVTSVNGGSSWSTESTLTTTPMNLSWLANTTDGYMVGDYISTSFTGGKAFPVFVTAAAPNGSQLNESLYTTQTGLSIMGGTVNASGIQARVTHTAPTVLYTAF
jgi:hypothetical protein